MLGDYFLDEERACLRCCTLKSVDVCYVILSMLKPVHGLHLLESSSDMKRSLNFFKVM